MIVDGRALANDIYRELRNQISHLDVKPHLTVFTCAPNFATKKYLNLKTKRAKEVGIGVNVIEFPHDVTTNDVVTSVKHACMQTDGVVVQLPLPEHLDVKAIIEAIPPSMDVDGMHYDGTGKYPIHPVAGAIAHIVDKKDMLLAAQKVVVVGQGRLVGAPVATWARTQGASVTILTKDTKDNQAAIAEADVLILGAGQPGLITPGMIKEGVAIFDAGTSEVGGYLAGDADPACAKKASLFTPVPGGIGPVTVAILLRNVVGVVEDGQP